MSVSGLDINMDSILAKAEKCMKTSKKKKEVSKIIDEAITEGRLPSGVKITVKGLHLAASKFIEVLQNEIRSHAGTNYAEGDLGATAIKALTQLERGRPHKLADGKYQIDILFTDERGLRRDSLELDWFDEGVYNLAGLLEKGYDEVENRIYGYWRGNRIANLKSRKGAHFIENAIRDYMGNYAAEYGVIDIIVDDIYK